MYIKSISTCWGSTQKRMALATNPMYADHLEQTHVLFGATSTLLSLKTRAQPLLHGLVNSKNESESKFEQILLKLL